MTLEEFAGRDGGKGFLGHKLEEIKHNLTMAKDAHCIWKEKEVCWNTADQYFYYVWGYIMAAYDHGSITWDEKTALIDELLELFKEQGRDY